jgi:hypothetical protein
MPEMRWHPYAETFPLIVGQPWDDFLGDIQKAGGNDDPVKYRMVRGRREYLDGRNRVRACKTLGIQFKEEEVYVPDDEVEDYIRRRNLHRRHLTIEERRAEVARRRSGGESIRTIAEAVGASPATVHRDIEANETPAPGVPHETPGSEKNGTVAGKDGKTYPAKTRKLCDRCERIAPGAGVKGCPACRDLNRKAPKGKGKARPAKATLEAPKDAFGNTVPARCLDAYCDPWIQETIDFLGVTVTQYWEKRMADGMKKREKHYPFFKAQDFIDGHGFAGNYLEQMLEHLKQNRPAGVCPKCKGDGCGHCRMSGLVPRALYEELRGKEAPK